MEKDIPTPVIGFLSEELPAYVTHNSLDNLFQLADAPGDPPEGTKSVKIRQWLTRINRESDYPLVILGRLLQRYLDLPDEEAEVSFFDNTNNLAAERKFKLDIEALLKRYNLTYYTGGG